MLKDDIKAHNKLVKAKTNFDKQTNILSVEILEELKQKNIIIDYFTDGDYTIINADCIPTMKAMIDKGILFDHIITDIPYGTVQGLEIEGWKNSGTVPNWDCPIPIPEMLDYAFNISRANANMILFSQEPMTFKLNYELTIFQKYILSNKMAWIKNNHANGFSAKTTPLNYYEEMLLIRKALDETNSIEIRKYFKEMLEFINIPKKEIMEKLGQGLDHCFRYANRTFYIPTEKNYNALIETFHINQMANFMPYATMKDLWDKENTTVFNIPKGDKIVKNVFEFKKDTKNIHPTQKPVALLEKLVQIFSNKDDTILDFACGSSSTGIAAIKNDRKFVGIELDHNFYTKAIEWYKQQKTK
jgi:site-specific DNA-methyltransferase (adenine-specific)